MGAVLGHPKNLISLGTSTSSCDDRELDLADGSPYLDGTGLHPHPQLDFCKLVPNHGMG
jgi:hypothetical protein